MCFNFIINLNKKSVTMKNYSVGIIGYGGFGKFLHHWWSTLQGVTVVALSGGNPNDPEIDNVRHYEDWQELINDETIDIVSIATPPSLHVEMACAAMRSNKHVLLEKPVALTLEGVEELLRTQHETGMIITVDHMLRYNPIVKALKELSINETFGKLRHVVVSNYAQDDSLPPEHWFWDKAVAGGIFLEHAVHFFDIVNALSNQKVVNVSGCSHNRNEKQEDQVSATVLYDQGLIATHYHSFSGPGFFEETTMQFNYDLARIEVKGWVPLHGTFKALTSKTGEQALMILPGLNIDRSAPITEITDLSRPDGWGDVSGELQNTVRCGGLEYTVDNLISGSFEIAQSKSEIYGSCVQEILSDIIKKIENPEHKLNITMQDAYDSLKIAVSAEKSAAAVTKPE